MYNSSDDRLQIESQDSILCEATIAFLTKLWLGNRLKKTYDLTTTQFVFLLPKENFEARFVEEFLRPLLLQTPWSSPCDPKNKLIFISDMQAFVYSLQSPDQENNITLQREGKYLICNIQDIKSKNEIAIELDAVQMVYDKDTVAASGQSIVALGNRPLLEPKTLSPTVTHKFTVAPFLEDLRRLAKFVFLRVFADSSDDIIGDDRLSDYCGDNKHYSKELFQNLVSFIRSFIDSKITIDSSHQIDMNFKDSPIYGKLTKDQQEKLSSITYEEIFKNFDPGSNSISITAAVKEYLQNNFTDEIISSTLISKKHEYWDSLSRHTEYWIYKELVQCYFSKVSVDLIRQLHDIKENCVNHSLQIIFGHDSLEDGCVYKAFKMLEISSKLQQPIIKHHSRATSTGSISGVRENLIKDALIDGIKAYGFYVEADITAQVIKFSLNQVVETNEAGREVEKSTLPVSDFIQQLDDMYETICVNIWNMAELGTEGYLSSSDCDYSTEQLEHYTEFKIQLKVLIGDMLTDRQKEIVDLDEKINFLEEGVYCKHGATITHRNIMEIGILPYLKEIAIALAFSLKAKAMFANYKVSCMVITGELLQSWLTRFNTVYADYMWTKLSDELLRQFYARDIRTNFILTKDIILGDRDQRCSPVKRQKYLQISSKDYVLNIRKHHGPAVTVYHCQDDRCSKISMTRTGEFAHWRTPLWTSNQRNGLHPICLEEEFLIHLKKSDLNSYQVSDSIKWILYSIEIMETSSTMQKVPETQDLPKEGRILRLMLNNHFWFNDRSLDDELYEKTTFPLKVKIEPCTFSASVRVSMCLGVNMFDERCPLNEYIAHPLERLTLAAI
ncbi:hypothetical protein FB192DRAFT_1401776 [Mucor lusitanicus]|uniref:Uncharacterized protein n=1 Tax=Mucor circinelloides f. lusitanicus TaxID=29924 RepID=A0A8H4EX48_MUCCL|nr:hypothetical protein FB192DRAFT_1401776 [Mucor lusitanicus]